MLVCVCFGLHEIRGQPFPPCSYGAPTYIEEGTGRAQQPILENSILGRKRGKRPLRGASERRQAEAACSAECRSLIGRIPSRNRQNPRHLEPAGAFAIKSGTAKPRAAQRRRVAETTKDECTRTLEASARFSLVSCASSFCSCPLVCLVGCVLSCGLSGQLLSLPPHTNSQPHGVVRPPPHTPCPLD